VLYFFPGIATHYRDTATQVDPAEVQRKLDNIIVPQIDIPGLPGGGPDLGIPPPRL
jgi:hypothetical protein